jgi:hypothetical protein
VTFVEKWKVFGERIEFETRIDVPIGWGDNMAATSYDVSDSLGVKVVVALVGDYFIE